MNKWEMINLDSGKFLIWVTAITIWSKGDLQIRIWKTFNFQLEKLPQKDKWE